MYGQGPNPALQGVSIGSRPSTWICRNELMLSDDLFFILGKRKAFFFAKILISFSLVQVWSCFRPGLAVYAILVLLNNVVNEVYLVIEELVFSSFETVLCLVHWLLIFLNFIAVHGKKFHAVVPRYNAFHLSRPCCFADFFSAMIACFIFCSVCELCSVRSVTLKSCTFASFFRNKTRQKASERQRKMLTIKHKVGFLSTP